MIHILAILMSFLKHAMFLIILLKCLQDNLSSSGIDKLLYLAIELINSSSENCQDRWQWTLFYFLFSLYFTLLYFFLFNFLFLEQLGLGFISHAVTSVTNWWRSHKTDHGTWEKKVEGSGTKWHHTTWSTHAGLMLYSWSFRVGCTVASTDHG